MRFGIFKSVVFHTSSKVDTTVAPNGQTHFNMTNSNFGAPPLDNALKTTNFTMTYR